MNLIKTIIKHASKYFTGSIIASVATFLMMKYYTHVFTPEQFGILSLYLIVFKYFITICSLDVQSSVSRLYFDYKDKERKVYISTVFWFLVTICSVVLILGMFLSEKISILIYPETEDMFILTIIAAIFSVFLTFFTRILYNEQKSTILLKQSILQTTLNHGLSVIFIACSSLGLLGRLLGQTLASMLSLLYNYIVANRIGIVSISRSFQMSMLKSTLLLSMPTLLLAVQSMVFLYMDRFLIKYYIGENALGIYSFAFMLGQGLAILYEAIYQAILPDVYKKLKTDYESSLKTIHIFFKKYFVFVFVITICISYFSDVILVVISNPNYYESSKVIPYIMFGFMMGGLYKIPTLVINFHKKIWIYPIASMFSSMINLVLNILLIPILGIIGAALASFLGLFVYSSILQIYTNKYYLEKRGWWVLISYATVFIIVMGNFFMDINV
ncbi:oligosaccharide flippase family protein [Aliivibrio sp. S4TY2]|uniref:lipopolysaccharide biosynthesis protein n=1 Tax=unclassified Aliivibrio TaxID=2645654 RepID=UPI0023791E4B|nr:MULTISPECIES: oligosaccharide flippase family protein [unclassified Aliivibrio]MDD9155982.1 oligosaccharide flippase family protein [Aliivibrio sp. S4TY2]MDD9159691.1 oligosaccharide flippase family protein [Aliivibrio sp. S4TY1]MDD9163691.1 oligosaccharide flippase family protein [Aliivibrio sp. S4MY2]MDD9167691.1 oligosaccharide flippase family protein [Aliivibrio sp. S4MY4]MDD9185645.1 oligosaccharide flippase family protein [Aliivibrio sp. S4MY3]